MGGGIAPSQVIAIRKAEPAAETSGSVSTSFAEMFRDVSTRFGVAYTPTMRSVADDLRDELQDEALRLPFEERMALVLRLGERGLELFRQANGLDRETAIRELQRQRQAGRTPSKCMSELIG